MNIDEIDFYFGMENSQVTGNWDNHKILLNLALFETRHSTLPILELGCGSGSSPYFQNFASKSNRKLCSYDFDKEWAEKYSAQHISDWDEIDWNQKFSVALVDESPGEHRHKSLMLLKDNCDIVILHDSEPAAEDGYMLYKAWPLYKYKVDLVSNGAWATALSNTIDVTKWSGMHIGEYEIRNWNQRKAIAFCSVAFGPEYVKQQDRLTESILRVYPDAQLFFYTDRMPPGSKSFLDSLYGFKVHAIKEARDKGYKKIVWIDAACILNHPFDYPDQLFEKYGVLVVKDENLLKSLCSTKAMTHFNVDKPQLDSMFLVGGSFYYFDFTKELCHKIFNDWYESEKQGIFGSQDEASSGQLQGHRHDETCMALSLYKNGSSPIIRTVLKYNDKEDDIIIKRHFK